jgi:energy-coupling factor transport system permease protein
VTSATSAAELPEFVARPGSGPYRGLAPTTRLVIAFAMALFAFTVRGWTGPLAVLALLVPLSLWARVGRGYLPYVLATVPFAVSVLLINTFLYPGAEDVIFTVGPFSATATGFVDAVQTALRVLAFALSVGLFALTTPTAQLVADLESRGLGRRAAFVLGAAVGLVPRLIEHAREIAEAQRARGLDTEGSLRRRVRGVIPLAGPLVVGALSDVEDRAMALEARAFTAPGQRTVLRHHPDGPAQRALRWSLVLGTVLLVVAAVGGWLAWLP